MMAILRLNLGVELSAGSSGGGMAVCAAACSDMRDRKRKQRAQPP